MEPAVLQAKTLWNFADALGKNQKEDHELYGDVPDVEALEAAAREQQEREAEESARVLVAAAEEDEESYLDGFLQRHEFAATAPASPTDPRSQTTDDLLTSPVLRTESI